MTSAIFTRRWLAPLATARRERPWHEVPQFWRYVMLVVLLLQLLVGTYRPRPSADASALPQPPGVAWVRLSTLDEPQAAASVLMLYLQAFDHQSDRSLPFSRLDYGRLTSWLDRLVELNPRADAPLLAATQVYSAVNDPVRQRRMLEFVHRQSLRDPVRRWHWLALAIIQAQHRLGDVALARQWGRDLRLATREGQVPAWVRQLDLFTYEGADEQQQAKVLLGGVVAAGEIRDERELAFLIDRLGLHAHPTESQIHQPRGEEK